MDYRFRGNDAEKDRKALIGARGDNEKTLTNKGAPLTAGRPPITLASVQGGMRFGRFQAEA